MFFCMEQFIKMNKPALHQKEGSIFTTAIIYHQKDYTMKSLISFAALLFITQLSFAQRIDYKKQGAPMPPFLIEKTTGGNFTDAQLAAGKPVMIMIFSPECDHCEHMIDSLKSIEALFKTTQVVLVAEERNKERMPEFALKHKLIQDRLFKNLGTNRGELIAAVYTQKVLPQILFYDSHHKLVKIFDGNYALQELKPYIQ